MASREGPDFCILDTKKWLKKLLSSPCEIRHIEVSVVQILLWME